VITYRRPSNGIIRKPPPRHDTLVQMVRRLHRGPILVQLEPVLGLGDWRSERVELVVAKRRLTPGRGLSGSRSRADGRAEARVGKVPVVDLGAVDRVGAVRRPGGKGDLVGGADIWTARARETSDVEAPESRENPEARLGGNRLGTGQAGSGRHEGGEDDCEGCHSFWCRGRRAVKGLGQTSGTNLSW